jgi:protease-4
LAEKKPTVATIGTLAASAGYMTAIAADHIVAGRTSITGSIGVYFQYGSVVGLLDKIGVEVKTVKSAPLKAEPSPFTEPEVPGAREMIGRLVDDTYQWFVDIVAERRGLDRAEALRLADGSIFSGRQALGLKLVDEIGGEAEALAWLEKERGVAADLPVEDWKPKSEANPLGLGSRALLAAGRAVGLDLSFLVTVPTLDGLVSVWHPQLSDAE